MPEVARVVLRNETGGFLLVQERKPRAYGKYTFLGGRVELGESPADAAIREAGEEGNLKVRLLCELLATTIDDGPETWGYHAFLGEPIDPQALRFNYAELLGGGLFDLNQIRELDAAGQTRDPLVLAAALKTEEIYAYSRH